MFMGSFPLELGATTPLMYALRDRERVLDVMESVTGGRFHPNFNRIGGVKPAAGAGKEQKKRIQDLPAGFFTETLDAMDKVLETCDELERLLKGNEIFVARAKGVGILPPEVAISYGVTGPNLRGSGVPFDLRLHTDYLPYDQVDFEVPVGETGDSFDRWWVRMEEIRQAAHIVKQAVEKIPDGPLQAKVPKVIKIPKGETYVRAEVPKGVMGYYLVSEGGQGPYRLKIRTASFSNLSMLPWILEGVLVPDLLAVMGSLDFVLGDVDR
jgi:NADH-quinone oxidoreductase subunit D